jgi:hypothetical protein
MGSCEGQDEAAVINEQEVLLLEKKVIDIGLEQKCREKRTLRKVIDDIGASYEFQLLYYELRVI